MFHQQPVTAVVPGATPGSGKPQPCLYGAMAGNCTLGGNSTHIRPGESATWKYLLEGDFHFTHEGTYSVELTAHPDKVFSPEGEKEPAHAKPDQVTQTVKLVVLPKDDAELLAREKQMAAEVEADISQKETPVRPRSESLR